jgi:hypothetical protein
VTAASAEQRLALYGAGTAERRGASLERARELAATADWGALDALLRRQRLLGLMGERLAGLDPPQAFTGAARELTAATRLSAVTHELLVARVARGLAERGIRSLVLKGPVMARDLYGDPGLRPSADLDLLVAPADLDAAGAELARSGYAIDGRTRWSGDLPLLHHRYLHAGGLPPIELHWRIHWYERRFAAAMLARAEPGPDGSLRAAPADELASLLLFYARDGLAGLRQPADIAQWWDTRGAELPPGALAAVAAEFPELRRALAVAGWQARRLTGVPLAATVPPHRGAGRAARAGDWALAGSDSQLQAAAHLADLLMAPAGARGAALQRTLVVAPVGARGLRAALAVAQHAPRVLRRWARAAWATRGGREAAVAPPAQPV